MQQKDLRPLGDFSGGPFFLPRVADLLPERRESGSSAVLPGVRGTRRHVGLRPLGAGIYFLAILHKTTGLAAKFLPNLGLDGWARDVPQAVEEYALLHYRKP